MAVKPHTAAEEPAPAAEDASAAEESKSAWVRFVHPNGPLRIARLGLVVNTDDVVEVPADVAKRLLAAPTLWQPAEAPAANAEINDKPKEA